MLIKHLLTLDEYEDLNCRTKDLHLTLNNIKGDSFISSPLIENIKVLKSGIELINLNIKKIEYYQKLIKERLKTFEDKGRI